MLAHRHKSPAIKPNSRSFDTHAHSSTKIKHKPDANSMSDYERVMLRSAEHTASRPDAHSSKLDDRDYASFCLPDINASQDLKTPQVAA